MSGPPRREPRSGTLVGRLLGLPLKLLISASLTWYVLRGMDWSELAQVFAAARLDAFALAILLFVLSNCIGAAQWHLLLRAQDLAVSPRQSVLLYHVGIFFNNVLLGNIGGDAVRIYDVRRLTGHGTAGAAATLMDRFVGLLSTCTLALAAYPFVAGSDRTWVVPVLAPVWGGLVAALAVGLSPRLGDLLETVAQRALPARLAGFLSRLQRLVAVYRQRPGLLAGVLGISLAVQFCRILVYYAAGLAVGMDPGVTYFVCFQPVAAIVAALPVSVGGLGVREGALVGLFAGVGVGRNASLAMSLLGFVAGIAASLLGGIAFVLRRTETDQPVEKA